MKFAFVVVVAAVVIGKTVGFPDYATQLPNGDNVELNGKKALGVGHISSSGGGAPNAFGKDFMDSRYKWTEGLCRMDSDGDGLTNGEELGE